MACHPVGVVAQVADPARRSVFSAQKRIELGFDEFNEAARHSWFL